jgi:mannose-1-phosphate guanylyltransferase
VQPVDEGGNVIVGEVRSLDTTHSIIVSNGLRVAIVGLSEIIVVASKDGVLVCPKERAQEVKRLVRKSS